LGRVRDGLYFTKFIVNGYLYTSPLLAFIAAIITSANFSIVITEITDAILKNPKR